MSGLPSSSGAFHWPMLGRSMEPTLLPGDSLLLVPLVPPALPGDVVVARIPTGWVVHRVLTWTDARVVTRGDACIHAVAPVVPSDVLYRVAAVTREGETLGLPPERPSLLLQWRRLRARLRVLPPQTG